MVDEEENDGISRGNLLAATSAGKEARRRGVEVSSVLVGTMAMADGGRWTVVRKEGKPCVFFFCAFDERREEINSFTYKMSGLCFVGSLTDAGT
mmetsp:Transcript_294/g.718  ORF Transcript_294/g.718 Transcript_294/m.718 type:complete len:94 (-) Transcript_294:96-377(-)